MTGKSLDKILVGKVIENYPKGGMALMERLGDHYGSSGYNEIEYIKPALKKYGKALNNAQKIGNNLYYIEYNGQNTAVFLRLADKKTGKLEYGNILTRDDIYKLLNGDKSIQTKDAYVLLRTGKDEYRLAKLIDQGSGYKLLVDGSEELELNEDTIKGISNRIIKRLLNYKSF